MNADDFGFTNDTAKTTIGLLDKGCLSSATIMVNCEASKLAIEYAKKHPEFSFGVHLTFIDNLLPVYECHNSSILKDGKFFITKELYIRALLGKIKLNDIKNEISSQISRLYDNGISVSHVDSHGNIHKLPIFQRALEEILPKFGINKIRREQNIFQQAEKESIPIKLLKTYIKNKASTKFISPDYFYMPAHRFDREWTRFLINTLDSLPQQKESVIEIAVHPGTEEYYRTFEYTQIIEFSKEVINSKHTMVNYNEL